MESRKCTQYLLAFISCPIQRGKECSTLVAWMKAPEISHTDKRGGFEAPECYMCVCVCLYLQGAGHRFLY